MAIGMAGICQGKANGYQIRQIMSFQHSVGLPQEFAMGATRQFKSETLK